MGHCYSVDLRVRVADFVEAGHSCWAAAQHFDVRESFAIKLVRRTRDTGSPAPARQGRPPGRGKLMPYETFLIQTVEARPAITMPELAARLLEEHGVVAAPAMLSRFLCRRGFSYKKQLMAAECARAAVRDERRVWRDQRQPRMREQPHRLVFLDETYVNTKDDAPARALAQGPAAAHDRALWALENPYLCGRAAVQRVERPVGDRWPDTGAVAGSSTKAVNKLSSTPNSAAVRAWMPRQ
jgi:transposase